MVDAWTQTSDKSKQGRNNSSGVIQQSNTHSGISVAQSPDNIKALSPDPIDT